MMVITNPDKFAARFNTMYPGAYRDVTAQDIRDMTECGLIRRYDYYSRQDLETVRGILEYEVSVERRVKKSEVTAIGNIPTCKRCARPLPTIPVDKKGRPREYCPDCESVRSRERYRKWRRERQTTIRSVPSGHN